MSSPVIPLLLLGGGALLLMSGKKGAKKSGKSASGLCVRAQSKSRWISIQKSTGRAKFPFLLIIHPNDFGESNAEKLKSAFCQAVKNTGGGVVIVKAGDLSSWENRVAQPGVVVMLNKSNVSFVPWGDVLRGGGTPVIESALGNQVLVGGGGSPTMAKRTPSGTVEASAGPRTHHVSGDYFKFLCDPLVGAPAGFVCIPRKRGVDDMGLWFEHFDSNGATESKLRGFNPNTAAKTIVFNPDFDNTAEYATTYGRTISNFTVKRGWTEDNPPFRRIVTRAIIPFEMSLFKEGASWKEVATATYRCDWEVDWILAGNTYSIQYRLNALEFVLPANVFQGDPNIIPKLYDNNGNPTFGDHRAVLKPIVSIDYRGAVKISYDIKLPTPRFDDRGGYHDIIMRTDIFK